MPQTLFSLLSWNVEHFGKGKDLIKKQERLTKIVQQIQSINPDVMAIYEVTGKEVFNSFKEEFREYNFFITEGPQSQEILIGTRNSMQTFITQRMEFKASNNYLRPGALLSITFNDDVYSILFLHLKSMVSPYGWGLRDFMWDKVRSLKKALNKQAESPTDAKYIALGDLNTMGMNYSYGNKDISGQEEVERMAKLVSRSTYNMKLLNKTHPNTYFNGSNGTYPPSNLDHVFATKNINFRDQDGAPIKVGGWNEAADPDLWIQEYSDHAFLYFEVTD
jgi:endonuclease/exonuclease/phosphatase family metal-dependent hydrolase